MLPENQILKRPSRIVPLLLLTKQSTHSEKFVQIFANKDANMYFLPEMEKKKIMKGNHFFGRITVTACSLEAPSAKWMHAISYKTPVSLLTN